MKSILIFTIAFVFVLPLSAFGQSSIVVSTDRPYYSEGETIHVTGEVSQLLGGYALAVIVIAPNGDLVIIDQLTVGNDKTFTHSFDAGGSLMKSEGTYTITVQYGDNKNNSATSTFEFRDVVDNENPDTIPPVIITPNDKSVESTVSNGSVVTFSVSATDNVDGTVNVSCSPTSGSLFSIGVTTVTCVATDSVGNSASNQQQLFYSCH